MIPLPDKDKLRVLREKKYLAEQHMKEELEREAPAAKETAESLCQSTKDFVAKHPVASVAAAACVGFLLTRTPVLRAVRGAAAVGVGLAVKRGLIPLVIQSVSDMASGAKAGGAKTS